MLYRDFIPDDEFSTLDQLYKLGLTFDDGHTIMLDIQRDLESRVESSISVKEDGGYSGGSDSQGNITTGAYIYQY
jgi:hypothetical protein